MAFVESSGTKIEITMGGEPVTEYILISRTPDGNGGAHVLMNSNGIDYLSLVSVLDIVTDNARRSVAELIGVTPA